MRTQLIDDRNLETKKKKHPTTTAKKLSMIAVSNKRNRNNLTHLYYFFDLEQMMPVILYIFFPLILYIIEYKNKRETFVCKFCERKNKMFFPMKKKKKIDDNYFSEHEFSLVQTSFVP